MKPAYIEKQVAPGVKRGRRHHDISHALGEAKAEYERARHAGREARMTPTISGEYLTPLGDVFDFAGSPDPVKRQDLHETARVYLQASGRGGTPEKPVDRVSHAVTANLISGVAGAAMVKELGMLTNKKVVEVDYRENIDPKLFETDLKRDKTLVARHTEHCSAADLECLQAWQSDDSSKLLVFEMDSKLVFNPFNGPKIQPTALRAWGLSPQECYFGLLPENSDDPRAELAEDGVFAVIARRDHWDAHGRLADWHLEVELPDGFECVVEGGYLFEGTHAEARAALAKSGFVENDEVSSPVT